MKATLSDKIYLTDLSRSEASEIKKTLTFINPKFNEALKFNRSVWNIPRTLELFEEVDAGLIVPRGFNIPASAIIQDDRKSNPVEIFSVIKPRLYQERVIRLALTYGGGVVVAPTGSGKTTMGIELASRLGERCLILVKSLDLAKQWQGAIKQFTGLACGLIGGGKFVEGCEFTVGLVQSLVKLEQRLDYGLVIVDECHNTPAAQAYEVINRQNAKYRYGLSATPERRDNLEFMIYSALGDIVAKVESS